MPSPKSHRRPKAVEDTNQQSEKEFQETLTQVAKAGKWNRLFHVIDQGPNAATTSIAKQLHAAGMHEAAALVERIGYRRVTAKGYPDWTLSHDQHGIIVAELKSDSKSSKATDDQKAWLLSFARSMRPPENEYAPSRTHLWRPQHWPAIETQLYVTMSDSHCYCDICEFMRNNPIAA